MKTKTILSLPIIAVMLVGVIAGCEAQLKEVTYKEMPVGRMTMSIPSDWERADKRYADQVEGMYSSFLPEVRPAIQIGVCDVPNTRGIVLIFTVLDMRKFSEQLDAPWEGWESALEAAETTGEELATNYSSMFISSVKQPTNKVESQLTIHGNEVFQTQLTGRYGDVDVLSRINQLVVFGSDDLALLFFAVEEGKWQEYENIWYKIRDSLQFLPQG